MLYPECMIIVTISKWNQFSSYQAALEHPAVAVLASAEFAEEKKKLNTYSGSPHQGLPIPGDRDGLDKTLLSILSEDESTRMISEGRGVLSLLINTPRAEQPLRHRVTSCAWSPEAAGSLHFLVLDWGMALLHTGGDRTLLGTQPPMPCYIRCTTTRSEKTTMALLSLCM